MGVNKSKGLSMKKALITGGHGFIGHHIAQKLKRSGYWVRTADIQEYQHGILDVNDYVIADLRDINKCIEVFKSPDSLPWDEVYCMAAWMGGAAVIFTGNNDAMIAHDSALLDINSAEMCQKYKPQKIFFSSSACVYNEHNQLDPNNPLCSEASAYPANPDSTYGKTKLWSETLYQSYAKNYNLNIKIARFHNIFGPETAWNNGKEKAPAALCRKVAETPEGGNIEIWGPGTQTRSFLYIDECLEGVDRLMASDFTGPVNIGSTEMISINNLAKLIMDIAGKKLGIKNIPGPMGVMGRNSDNTLIQEKLGWAPSKPLRYGLEKLYQWIEKRV